MVSDREFIDRIQDFRRRSVDALEAEQEAVAAATSEMDAALGSMASFRAMNSSVFQVEVEEVPLPDAASEIPDFGAVVTAVRRRGECTRVSVQARTLEADEFISLSLHPSEGSTVWRMEASSRAFDGTDRSGKKDYASAGQALRALKARLLGLAVHVLSKGEMAGLPVLPEGDEAAAKSVEAEISAARKAGLAIEERRRRQAGEAARAANAIMSIWSVTAPTLSFLEEIGYRVGEEAMGRGIVASRGLSGASVRIAAGETWSRLTVEAMQEDLSVAAVRIEDSEGRKEVRCYVPVDDAEAVASEMRQAVLDEIEAAESAYLPAPKLDKRRSPGM